MALKDPKLLLLQQLSSKLKKWYPLREEKIPPSGWIKTIRTALGLPAGILGKRMGVSQQRVYAMEEGEAEGKITLQTLKKAADALDFEFIYVFAPKRSSLKDYLYAQGRKKAMRILKSVHHTMRLEAQEVGDFEKKVDELARRFAATPNSELWKE